MGTVKYLTPEEFRRMQLIQIPLIQEVDRVCRKHDIKYTISCGTLLGAVRHKGYIPWDDDADITMLREDFEKFRKVANEMDPEIAFYQDHYNDPDYLWEYPKVRRVGTKFVRVGQEHINCQTGVAIDIFPLDDVPKSVIGQIFQDMDLCLLRKILYARVGKLNRKGIKKLWYEFLSLIPVDYVYKRVEKYASKSSNSSPNRVRLLLFRSFGKLYTKHPLKERYSMPKEWFLNRAEYEFEGHKFYGIEDYDAFLKYMYDDYMTLPPEDKRQPHAPVSEYEF